MRTRPSNGIVVGVVKKLDDPDSLGRVQVEFPHLDDQRSEWAHLASLMAGGGRGAFFRPNPEDKVLIGFEHGDPTRPYVLGGLWSQADKPPEDDGKPTENNWRFFKSRSGHVFKLDDTDGKERIEIVDKDGSRKVVIDSSGSKIQIDCGSGDVEITASGTVKVEGQTVNVHAKGDMTLEAAGTMTIKGSTVNIN
jgi:uncharacterized protein involved in type VI secretion and phage assembly